MCNVYVKLDPILNQAQRFLNLKKCVKTKLQGFKMRRTGLNTHLKNLQLIFKNNNNKNKQMKKTETGSSLQKEEQHNTSSKLLSGFKALLDETLRIKYKPKHPKEGGGGYKEQNGRTTSKKTKESSKQITSGRSKFPNPLQS